MPLPAPHKNESEKDFVARCNSEIASEYPEADQRNAICFKQFREKDKKKKEAPPPDGRGWLKADLPAHATGGGSSVDRKAGVLRSYVLAQLGPFKSAGRGEFDEAALREIVRLGNRAPKGLKVRLGHPEMSSDSTAQFLGRARDLRMAAARDDRTGRTVPAVRGDLHFDATALDTPIGGGKPKGVYVMDRAESDPDSLSSSLVLEADEEYRLTKDGTPQANDDGDPLPPLWRPTRVHASDIVDTGDAVDGLLSSPDFAHALAAGDPAEWLSRFDRLPQALFQVLRHKFRNNDDAYVREHGLAFVERFLASRRPAPARPKLDAARGRLDRMAKALAEAR